MKQRFIMLDSSYLGMTGKIILQNFHHIHNYDWHWGY